MIIHCLTCGNPVSAIRRIAKAPDSKRALAIGMCGTCGTMFEVMITVIKPMTISQERLENVKNIHR